MPNILNKMIKEELASLFDEAANCLIVDFNGLDVSGVSELRSTLTKNDIQMQVVRTSLARLVLQEQERTGYEEMFNGQTAVIWGGDSIIQISKTVSDFAKKNKKLKIKGGFLNNGSITSQDVQKLTKVPDTPVLLANLAGLFTAPLRDICGGINSILSGITYAIDAVREKVEKGESA